MSPTPRTSAIQIIKYAIHKWVIPTRLPFKYGIATMTEVPHVIIALDVRIGGQVHRGFSADHLPPRWFTKNPAVSISQEIADMEASIIEALAASLSIKADNPFRFWSHLYQLLMREPTFPPLLQHFGISLVERAVLDAFCQSVPASLWQLVAENQLGIDLGSLSPELSGTQPADYLPARPLGRVRLRHTVGLADCLRDADIPPRRKSGGRVATVAGALPQGLRLARA